MLEAGDTDTVTVGGAGGLQVQTVGAKADAVPTGQARHVQLAHVTAAGGLLMILGKVGLCYT
jgi:hypothetical protein